MRLLVVGQHTVFTGLPAVNLINFIQLKQTFIYKNHIISQKKITQTCAEITLIKYIQKGTYKVLLPVKRSMEVI